MLQHHRNGAGPNRDVEPLINASECSQQEEPRTHENYQQPAEQRNSPAQGEQNPLERLGDLLRRQRGAGYRLLFVLHHFFSLFDLENRLTHRDEV